MEKAAIAGSHSYLMAARPVLCFLPVRKMSLKTYASILKQIRLHQSEFLRGCKGRLSEAEYAELLRSRREDVDFKPKMD